MLMGGYFLIEGCMQWKGIHGDVKPFREMTESDMSQFPYVEGEISTILGPYCEEEWSYLILIGEKERYYMIPHPTEENKYMSVKVSSSLFTQYDESALISGYNFTGSSLRIPEEISVQGKIIKIDNAVKLYMEERLKELYTNKDDAQIQEMISTYCIDITSEEIAKKKMFIGGIVFGVCMFFVIGNTTAALRKRRMQKRWNQAMRVPDPYKR